MVILILGTGAPLGTVILIGLVALLFVCVALFILIPRINEKTLRRKGRFIQATVVDVRDDRTDFQTIVTYEFFDPNTGKKYCRTGVLERSLGLPREGGDIEVIYLPDNPTVSRLKYEEGFESR
ncbi:DUF3592 domain-containing protein [Synechococcus sp. PCC 6312]|uniref:DUF3592 domain-containing protein n=1 Tax=Synechococcus sp. (strain ATCC 27167 / PCC 6312) TaxID=195253 RepID=UPI00029EF31E|nr:DUF3592 domain-containing protein [Synechococcus sp. PCC 6312]AFY60451.1 hypothetical protein Syn6312_1269 [Synechococcus sp. PCC 6312]